MAALTKNSNAYFQERMNLLGVTDEINKIKILVNDNTDGKPVNVLKEFPVFSPCDKGIEILVYTLDREKITITKEGSRFKKPYVLTRLEHPIIKSDGSTIKYLMPKGSGTYPFFPPALVDKFERTDPIDTLFLVEGFFKAFKASMEGIDIVGLSSITHMKDKDKRTLHPDIKRIIEKCAVKRIVWLTDGDALDITSKEITPEIDLYTRPNQFFNSVVTFKTLLSDYSDLEKWFFHIDIDNIMDRHSGYQRDSLKGIDDLLITMNEHAADIVSDIHSFSGSSTFFQKFNVSYGLSKVQAHFRISDPKMFYLFHVDRRPELKEKEFKFNGTRYKYDEDSGEMKIVIPSEAKYYFRVGDDYYKIIKVPNQFGTDEIQFQQRRKSTIVDDHGKSLPNHIPKYESFCNIPSHTNFQRVIKNCFNVYSPLDVQPDEEPCGPDDCPAIINLIRHIFGEKMAAFTDIDGVRKEYPMWHLGMDYVQLLYHNPQQKLPVLCLVSRENGTGKSTFGYFLRQMLGANTAIVGNADLSNEFNAHWATKSVVICDEAKIDKSSVVDKIKALSTAKKIFMNAKGRGQVELDCFIKFIMMSNNEDTFIFANDDDIRYWIIKVPVLKEENPNIMENLVDQLPQFLSYLNNRKMVSEMRSRMWFHPMLLRTDAFKKVVESSRPSVEREIRHYLKNLFLDTGLDVIRMTANNIHKEVFKGSAKYDMPYISKTIRENLNVDTYHVWHVEGLPHPYETEELALAAAGVKYPDLKDFLLLSKLQRKYKVIRYTFPRMVEDFVNGGYSYKMTDMSDMGRPFVFYRNDFVSEDETRATDIGAEREYIASVTPSDNFKSVSPTDNELPF
ncbi:MAG TPA: DUF5906 domain-containing protein [Ferruginibacter sp.]|nr:DUF5906 domain-containing protein [Ferruginibacter sp.]HRQ20554.1 DUF5906 domain-containing protein [Ferruginibacter sp.]